MSKTFFIADTHFGDDSIRRYENRPFDSTEQMDKALISNWNSVVTDSVLFTCSVISVQSETRKEFFQS